MLRCLVLLLLMVGTSSSAGCGGAPKCWLEALQVTYRYSTSCSDVAKERRGTLVFQAPLGLSSIRERQMEFVTQAQKAGLNVEEVLLVWSSPACGTNTESTPLTIQNYQRLTLAPDSGTSTVQRLLACEPIGSQPPGTLKKNFLFACRTGQSSRAVCTFELEIQEP